MSSSTSGKEQLKAACSDLEKIRKLKKEAEFLEASFRAKAASLQQVFYRFVLSRIMHPMTFISLYPASWDSPLKLNKKCI